MMPKYPHMKHMGTTDYQEYLALPIFDVLNVTEKIDGSNFRFKFHEGSVIFGSRNAILDNDAEGRWKNIVQLLQSKIDKNMVDKYNGYTFYGEATFKHRIHYSYTRDIPIA